MSEERFWHYLDELVSTTELVIDRPKGSKHPRYASMVYPLDYGYLAGTTSGDGQGVDVWVGSLEERHVTALLCCVDMLKRDSEIKLLLACTPAEIEQIVALHNQGQQAAQLLLR
ncbi:inorganic pyrophosphatase [Thermosporothrix hazakensis]|jgi:inorganic pyrophosphatase|uniref:Inorganic pyrophosphatase n=2 Tax=Thermosporothrix TaxID=768650 RepID=A0A326URI5_THEHA|nr:inorganic pyrophosphatase [Thermosporothrix hazakensis]PZW36559.1 inorganic pyrophosphatase [Thermosporothrix hazakensis]BBH89026.1 hypothetical protein KTC_37770 [Thermosporothrix sp. COM3]GCE47210.1 hypothetical protein KTH_20790 [Thermosporothrix hazakensis]